MIRNNQQASCKCIPSHISLLLLPVSILIFIYISYGEIFDQYLLEYTEFSRIYRLQIQISIFQSEILLPYTVRKIGYFSVILLYIIFLFWILYFSYSSYVKLKYSIGYKASILMEAIIILLIFRYIISPDIMTWIAIPGYVLIGGIILLVLLYWVDSLKIKNAKG